MKVLLINPRMHIKAYTFFPTSLGCLAAALDEVNIMYKLHDMHLNWESDKEFVENLKENYDVFAITGLLTSFPNIVTLTNILKHNFPNTKIVIGGRITVLEPEFILRKTSVDFIIQGEGEIAFIQFLNELKNNSENFDKIQGLAYINEKDEVISNGEAEPVNDINRFIPPYEKFDMIKYIEKCNIQSPDVASINMISSRGCPYKCTFCNNSKDQYKMRYYDIEKLTEKFDVLIKNYGLKHITFNDDIFILNKNNMQKMCLELKKRNLTFSISTRLDSLDESTIKTLDDSGCHYLCVGIESPAPPVAKVIDKRLDIEKYESNIKLLQESKIVVNYGFMFGYLGETEDTIIETRNFVLKNKLIYSAFFTNAFPRTKLYDMVKDRIADEEEYLKKLFNADLTKDYLINMTDIPLRRLYYLRDKLVVDSVINVLGVKNIIFKIPLTIGGLSYLWFMRNIGLKFGVIKDLFEFINMSIIKPLSKK